MNSQAQSRPATLHSRDALRQELRSRRRLMGAQQRARAAQSITRHIAGSRWLHGARPIGLYVSVGYEVDTAGLRRLARARHCPVYVPRIHDYRRHGMRFARDLDSMELVNRHGIPEPSLAEIIRPQSLSVVFLPLVGFDAQGTRLGAGAGYYDRAFAFRRHRQSWHRPLLVGIAFACQRLDHIERGAHDVPLDAVVTELGVEHF